MEDKRICWDMPCSMGFPICCFDCEAAEGCPEACDNLKCRGDDDTEDDM